jgi:hypothetical protein
MINNELSIALNENKVASYSQVLNLSIECYAEIYYREYYEVAYKNGTHLFFMTSNEPDAGWKFMQMYEDFICFKNSNELLQELSSNIVVNQIADWNRKLPGFLAYEPLSVDVNTKILFRVELHESLEGYASEDFSQRELAQIELWINNTRNE